MTSALAPANMSSHHLRHAASKAAALPNGPGGSAPAPAAASSTSSTGASGPSDPSSATPSSSSTSTSTSTVSTATRLGSALGGAAASWRAAQHRGSVLDEYPMYSCIPDDYELGREIGFGASSVVYEATFKPLAARVAVKVIDLEAYGRDTDELRRETQLMSLSKHPNVLRVRGCYLVGSKLHIATRLMAAGSMLDIMRFSHPDGFDEIVIATVLKQALQGLHYLHQNDWLHRDLKAANILVDDDGTVLLGDFGVGVWLGESTAKAAASAGAGNSNDDETSGRKSFVGTPAWMAPEVVERKHYGVKADIWSFGITALELCQGRAPHARFAPVKALMKTLSDEPPTLDREGGAHKYSKAMEDFVRVCLQKDPAKRPTAEKLLQHALFKQARGPKFLVNAILAGLPPLSERQERRRRISMSSMRTATSWDFGSIGAGAGGSGRWTPGTAGAERTDPFLGFTGIFGNGPTSPRGSVRSTRLGILEGQQARALSPSHSQVQLAAAGMNGTNRRSRNWSNDSGLVSPGGINGGSFGQHAGSRALAAHQRRSMSREVSYDDVASHAPAPGAGETPADAHPGLETIGEQKSPPTALLPVPCPAVHVPVLDLPPSPFSVEDQANQLQLSTDSDRWGKLGVGSDGQPSPTPPAPSSTSSRAVSAASTAASHATTTSAASSVATTVMTESISGGGTPKPGPGSLASGPAAFDSTEGGLVGSSVPGRVNSRSSARSATSSGARRGSASAQGQQAPSAPPTNLFLKGIRSVANRPGSRGGPSPASLGLSSSPAGSPVEAPSNAPDKGEDASSRHRRADSSVLGKLFGRAKKESK